MKTILFILCFFVSLTAFSQPKKDSVNAKKDTTQTRRDMLRRVAIGQTDSTKVSFKVREKYADMLADGTPAILTIYRITKAPVGIYYWWPDGTRQKITLTND